ncbi:hypothetical protein BDA99DRAFT_560214 [Phascolomyces articulosus]|uniref:Uncharacterized protein n=1 Tax=Phascolomyces articulosus TaxID=60185 RepID=A0AAD5PE24_9FUNG|nr:hypothetical protein BDA99DRAFT_560214 [Phascolomyces articulosus]
MKPGQKLQVGKQQEVDSDEQQQSNNSKVQQQSKNLQVENLLQVDPFLKQLGKDEKHDDYDYFVEGTLQHRMNKDNNCTTATRHLMMTQPYFHNNTTHHELSSSKSAIVPCTSNNDYYQVVQDTTTHVNDEYALQYFLADYIKSRRLLLLHYSSSQEKQQQHIFKQVSPMMKPNPTYPLEEERYFSTSSSASSLSDEYIADELTTQEARYYGLSLTDPEYNLKLLAQVTYELLIRF